MELNIEWRLRIDLTKSRGKPPIKWKDDIKRTTENWIQVTQDREKWNKLRRRCMMMMMMISYVKYSPLPFSVYEVSIAFC